MFDSLLGNRRAKEILKRMLAQGRVPGALLFAGEEGVGKKLFALELARALNCRRSAGVEACGECPACVRVGRVDYPAGNDKDDYKKLIWSEHPDVGMVLPYNRSVYVHAIRDLERETNFRPVEGRARVFLVEDADRLSESSSNALLKTLEEPHATSHLILLTSRPAGLLPTIRSRCQIVRFSPLSAEEIEQHLTAGRKRAGQEARLSARLARGRLGVALSIDLDAYRERREQMLGILDALATTGDRSRLLRAAEQLGDAKNKDDYEPSLDLLETLIRDLWLLALKADGALLVNEDARDRLARMSAHLRPARASRWLSRVEELRAQLAVNVNRKAATDALFLAMASD
jgi:DNA polymerase III subunit delta'